MRKQILSQCKKCGKSVICQGRKGYQSLESVRRNAVYCSQECKKEWLHKHFSDVMTQTNQKYGLMRKPENNGMFLEENRIKVSNKLKEIGHKPKIQGGNGKGPTIAQQLLAKQLNWEMEVIVKTGQKKYLPSHYKIDIANVELLIAIEIDGNSHGLLKRKEQDQKKEKFLNQLGWKVLRFSNQQVMEHLEECYQAVMSLT